MTPPPISPPGVGGPGGSHPVACVARREGPRGGPRRGRPKGGTQKFREFPETGEVAGCFMIGAGSRALIPAAGGAVVAPGGGELVVQGPWDLELADSDEEIDEIGRGPKCLLAPSLSDRGSEGGQYKGHLAPRAPGVAPSAEPRSRTHEKNIGVDGRSDPGATWAVVKPELYRGEYGE